MFIPHHYKMTTATSATPTRAPTALAIDIIRENAMNDLKVDISVPFPSAREAEIAYQVLRVDKEPSRGGVTKKLTLNNNLLEVSFSGVEARKVRVGLTSFFESLILVTETIERFGPPTPSFNYY